MAEHGKDWLPRLSANPDLTAAPTNWAELEADAQVTPTDVPLDRRFWGQWGTPLFRAMLKAKEEK